MFVSLNASQEAIESRIKAEQFRHRVMLCFRNWEENAIYPRETLINMQNIFLGLVKVIQLSSI
jgi:U2-associated protein SR140